MQPSPVVTYSLFPQGPKREKCSFWRDNRRKSNRRKSFLVQSIFFFDGIPFLVGCFSCVDNTHLVRPGTHGNSVQSQHVAFTRRFYRSSLFTLSRRRRRRPKGTTVWHSRRQENNNPNSPSLPARTRWHTRAVENDGQGKGAKNHHRARQRIKNDDLSHALVFRCHHDLRVVVGGRVTREGRHRPPAEAAAVMPKQ